MRGKSSGEYGGSSLWRSRWAAMGAAVAVSLGAGGLFVAQAAPDASESTIVTVTPKRIMDTRDAASVGLPGPFVSPVSQKLQVTGSVPTSTGTQTVVPAGATGVLLNVTSVRPTADGFISVRPGDATGAPSTASLNVEAGSNIPNSVQVALPTSGPNAGQIDIVYDAYGVAGRTTDIVVDVVGYTTNTGIQDLVASKPSTLTVRVNSAIPTDGEPFIAALLDIPDVPRRISLVVNSTTNVFNTSAGSSVACSINVQGPVVVSPIAVDNDYSQRWQSPGPVGGVSQLSGTRMFSVPPGGGSIADVALVCQESSAATVFEDIVLTAVVTVD